MVLPAGVTISIVTLAELCSRKRDILGMAAAPTVVFGFLLGYWLLKLGPVVPEFDRDWLPYAPVLALVPTLIPGQSLNRLKLQLLVLAIVVIILAWLLVPTWDNLEPSPVVHRVAWSAYTFLLSSGMLLIVRADEPPHQLLSGEQSVQQDNRASRSGSRLLSFLIVATLAASSALLLLADILLFCKSMLVATAAFSGWAIAYWFFQCRSTPGGITLVYTLLICATMLTGKVNSFSSVPTASYLILPLTPLAYGLALPVQSVKPAWKRTLLVIVVALAICGVALGPAVAARSGAESEY